MRRFLFTLLLPITLGLNAQSPSFKTYMNPVIPGDHPDCTVTKVGGDYYTIGSSFNVTPVIYHSTDLVHWEAIAQPVSGTWSELGDKPGGGCWGGHVVYYNNQYWHYFSMGGSMRFVKADDPAGQWSTPVKVNNPSNLPFALGYDNSIFIDDDNKWYLVVKNGQANNAIVELGSNGQPSGTVYNLNWLNPSPDYPLSWAEGPVMWKYGGYYYYSFALNVAGGQKVMRSKTLTADESAWEFLGNFFNENDPQKSGSRFTSPNHSSPAVMAEDSTSWVVHPLYMKDEWKGQGRQGLLNQVKYTTNEVPVADYPINQAFTAPNLPSSGIPWMVPHSDFFDSETLDPEWSFLGYTASNKISLTDRAGWLKLSPKSSSKANTLIKNDGEHNYSLITRLDFSPASTKDEAGLQIIRGDETMQVKLVSTISSSGEKTIVFSFKSIQYKVTNYVGDTLWLKMVRTNHKISAYYGSKGTDWLKVGEEFTITDIDSYSDFSSWIGTRQGLYVAGTQSAYFDLYIYRDAFSPILAECPANQYGTTTGSLKNGIRPLDNIHNTDWALYAGVEFGNGDYYDIPDSVQFTASSATSGGNIEIWLDSIETGTIIGECTIAPTGTWTEFQTFSTSITPVNGNHDVYLRFTGTGTDKLFQLKWLNFSSSNRKTSALQVKNSAQVSVFPNPSTDEINIASEFLFTSVEIRDLTGKKVFGKEFSGGSNMEKLYPSLPKGLYVLMVGNNQKSETMKIVVE